MNFTLFHGYGKVQFVLSVRSFCRKHADEIGKHHQPTWDRIQNNMFCFFVFSKSFEPLRPLRYSEVETKPLQACLEERNRGLKRITDHGTPSKEIEGICRICTVTYEILFHFQLSYCLLQVGADADLQMSDVEYLQ